MAERMHTTPIPVQPKPKGWQKIKRFFSSRIRSGTWRARKALVPAATSAVAAVGAYAIAVAVLGHQGPYFAATSALITLGFGRDPHLKKALEEIGRASCRERGETRGVAGSCNKIKETGCREER